MMDIEKQERDMLGSEQKISQLWIPYRLSNFKQNYRHSAVEDIGRILLSSKFLQLSLIILRTVNSFLLYYYPSLFFTFHIKNIYISMESSCVRDSSVQLTIYLLTLAVQYASSLSPTAREAECDKRGNKREMLQKVLTRGELDKERIVGGAAEYIGRLLSIDEAVRLFLHCCLKECELKSETLHQKEDNEKRAILERKLASIF
uniref:NPH3 domain-containing protein n=1 Tax=Heterorhabditis bacteriophora TaxID=37862 RepID=A0A1I7X245_HETBA